MGSLGVLSFFYLLVELLLALLYTIDFFIQCFLALEQPALVALQLVASLSQFLFIFVLNAVGFFLGFKKPFPSLWSQPSSGVADHFFNCFFCVSYLCFRYIAPVNISTAKPAAKQTIPITMGIHISTFSVAPPNKLYILCTERKYAACMDYYFSRAGLRNYTPI